VPYTFGYLPTGWQAIGVTQTPAQSSTMLSVVFLHQGRWPTRIRTERGGNARRPEERPPGRPQDSDQIWFELAVQLQICSLVPLTVPLPTASRHLPEFALTSSPFAASDHCWAPVPLQV
jgi:hypothetical protein